MVTQKELKIMEEISKGNSPTQRVLSQRTKLSLGAVNIIIKRLIQRGFIKTKSLNTNKVEYIITPKGFSEKTKRSYDYVLKTISLVRNIKDEIAKIILDEFSSGQKKFVIIGDDDLTDIIELALKGFDYEKVSDVSEIKDKNALVLLGRTGVSGNGFRKIDLAKRLKPIYWGVD